VIEFVSDDSEFVIYSDDSEFGYSDDSEFVICVYIIYTYMCMCVCA